MPENNPIPPENNSVPPEKKWLGLTLGDVMKFALGLGAGLALAIFGFWLNSSSPHLTFEVSTPLQFQGEKTKFGIITLAVSNEGSKEAENVVCTFNTFGAKDPEIKVTPENLNATTGIKGDVVTVAVPSLNPGERISVVAHTPDVLPDRPKVSVRGKGVNGTERKAISQSPRSSPTPWWETLLMFILPMVTIPLIPLLFLVVKYFEQLFDERVQRVKDERERRMKGQD
jgi:hypothetical protein